MKTMRMRAIISSILIVVALLSLSTGAILYFLQYGMWLCFTRRFLTDIHVISGLIMGTALIIHFIINRQLYVREMKSLFSRKNQVK